MVSISDILNALGSFVASIDAFKDIAGGLLQIVRGLSFLVVWPLKLFGFELAPMLIQVVYFVLLFVLFRKFIESWKIVVSISIGLLLLGYVGMV